MMAGVSLSAEAVATSPMFETSTRWAAVVALVMTAAGSSGLPHRPPAARRSGAAAAGPCRVQDRRAAGDRLPVEPAMRRPVAVMSGQKGDAGFGVGRGGSAAPTCPAGRARGDRRACRHDRALCRTVPNAEFAGRQGRRKARCRHRRGHVAPAPKAAPDHWVQPHQPDVAGFEIRETERCAVDQVHPRATCSCKVGYEERPHIVSHRPVAS